MQYNCYFTFGPPCTQHVTLWTPLLMATRQFALTHTLLDSVADATRRENFTLLHFTVDSPNFVVDCLFLFLILFKLQVAAQSLPPHIVLNWKWEVKLGPARFFVIHFQLRTMWPVSHNKIVRSDTCFWIWISYLNFALVSSDLAEKTVNVYTCAFCLYFRRNKSELLQVAVQSLPPVVSPNEIVRFFAHKRKFPTGVCCN